MTTRMGLLVVLMGLAGCKKKEVDSRNAEPPPGSRATGLDFSIPIPPGWKVAEKEVMAVPPGAVALRVTKLAQPDYFMGSIIINAVAPEPPIDPTNLKFCQDTAQGLAGTIKGTVKLAGIIDSPFGKTCQMDLVSGSDNQEALETVIRGPKEMWMMTCNHDKRDSALAKDCETVLAGVKFQ